MIPWSYVDFAFLVFSAHPTPYGLMQADCGAIKTVEVEKPPLIGKSKVFF